MNKFFLNMVFISLAVFFAHSAFAELSKKIETEEDWYAVFLFISNIETDDMSGGVGDVDLTHRAYGISQIRMPYLKDALWWAKRNQEDVHATGLLLLDSIYGGISPEDLHEAHPSLSYVIFRCYMSRWATKSRLGHVPTVEDIIRIHNGGGPGYGKPWWRTATQRNVNKAQRRLKTLEELLLASVN